MTPAFSKLQLFDAPEMARSPRRRYGRFKPRAFVRRKLIDDRKHRGRQFVFAEEGRNWGSPIRRNRNHHQTANGPPDRFDIELRFFCRRFGETEPLLKKRAAASQNTVRREKSLSRSLLSMSCNRSNQMKSRCYLPRNPPDGQVFRYC